MFCSDDLYARSDPSKVLANLQGNILRCYKRLRARYVLFRFHPSASSASAWLRDNVARSDSLFAPTSAEQQEADYEGEGPACPVLKNFLITAEGMRFLGCDLSATDAAFQRGTRHEETIRTLNDLEPEVWPDEYRSPWHGMLVLAADDERVLNELVAQLKGSLAGIAQLHEESGNALDADGKPLSDPRGHRHEHFGYRDGLSQPVFLETHWRSLRNLYSEPVPPERDPRRPLSVVLQRDPLAGGPASYASYFVYRKLEQDVLGFRERVDRYAATLAKRGQFLSAVWKSKGDGLGYEAFASEVPNPQTLREFIMDRLMGRSLDGRPWDQRARDASPNLNDFDFKQDAGGRACPFYSHVRKMNPRGQTGDLADERRKTLARRGIPYGEIKRAQGQYKQDVGLLFLCAQASITTQFEAVQRQWANSESIDMTAVPTPTLDTIIGQRPRSRERAAYQEDRHHKISETIEVDLDFYDLVNLRGAEYLLAPSIEGIQSLAG